MTKGDATGFKALAEAYRSQADRCRQMAEALAADESDKREWLRLAAEWIRLVVAHVSTEWILVEPRGWTSAIRR
jgi:hypothetical protein